LTDAGYLDAREPAFLMALAPLADASGWGVALLDLSTGEFTSAEYHGADRRQALADELAILQPREIIAPEGDHDAAAFVAEVRLNARVTYAPPWTFDQESARQTLLEQLRAQSLVGFGLEERPAAVRAAGALVHYLRDTQKADLAHVREIAFRAGADCLVVDATTLRNLEVLDAVDGGSTGSLLVEIDRTMTSMGGRLLRAWLLRPLVALERIQDRLDAVEELAFRSTERAKLRDTLKTIHDVERLVARASLGIAGPRDLVALRQSIATVPRVRMLLSDLQSPLIKSLVAELDDLAELRDELDRTLLDEPPAVARDGGLIRNGIDAELDDLRSVSRSGKQHIAAMEDAERTRTGIASLKIRYNRVFGYYIEISKSNLANVPPDYHRKQTIAGGERFITPALKDYEEKVVGADERCLELEIAIFERLRARVAGEAPRIQDTARGLASLDVLAALAETAAAGNYTKPMMHAGDDLVAVDVRHPVVERHVPEAFVPNDVTLDGTTRQLIVLTGPNMGGKSTYMRQVALIVLLAHVGSFVPARAARIGPVDRIFTRIGAADDLAGGRSTFMVEMTESANILHNATEHSLVLMDEVGRGTSTFDGLALAWAIARHLVERVRGYTLFATHYFELTGLAQDYREVANVHLDAVEHKDRIVFLHALEEGPASQSYGLQVAALAGVPGAVIRAARRYLQDLEHRSLQRDGHADLFATPPAPEAERHPALDLLESVNPDELTPRDALELLYRLRKL
jgi:DNA mismatch repair protein MutS